MAATGGASTVCVVPRVSVITPAYNAAQVIGETLASVRAQTFTDWEQVIVDDQSTDDTLAAIERTSGSDPRVRIVTADAKLGPAGARNLAIRHAGGDLLAFLDADDAWAPEYLDRQVARYDAEQARTGDVGIVACNAHLVGPDGRLPGTYRDRFGNADGVTLTQLLQANRIFISALVPRAVLDEVGGFSTETWGSEDHDLWLRIVESGRRVVATDEPLVDYRVSEGSVSSSEGGMARTNQATYRRALARGNLSPTQRGIARRRLRLYRAVEEVARLRDERERTGSIRVTHALRTGGAVAGAALSFPNRWWRWARTATGSRRPRV